MSEQNVLLLVYTNVLLQIKTRKQSLYLSILPQVKVFGFCIYIFWEELEVPDSILIFIIYYYLYTLSNIYIQYIIILEI